MAKNISLLGADYPDVPAVQLPMTGGGTATFYDITDTYINHGAGWRLWGIGKLRVFDCIDMSVTSDGVEVASASDRPTNIVQIFTVGWDVDNKRAIGVALSQTNGKIFAIDLTTGNIASVTKLRCSMSWGVD